MLLCFQLFVLLLGCIMFVCPAKYKLCLLFLSYICFSSIVIDFIPFGKSDYFISICFIFSELPDITKKIKQLKQGILYKLLSLMIIATIVLAYFSPHYHDAHNFIRLFILELLGKYFAVAYAFMCIKNEKDFITVLKSVGIGLLFITMFGIHNYITKQSWWFHIAFPHGIKNTGLTGFETSNRFRVQSMFASPFDYGYICVLINLLFTYSYYKKYIHKTILLMASMGCLWGIMSCGCRSVLVVYVLGVTTFYYLHLSKKEKAILIFFVVAIIICVVLFIPHIFENETLESYSRIFEIDVAANGGNGYGSSLGMRILQLNAVLYHIQDSYMFGKGKDFFNIDMGWEDGGLSALVDKDLWGLEGLFLNYLLERGIIGLLFWFIFIGSIFYFLYKRKITMREEVALGLSVLMSYLSFANMTGELSSVFPTLLILGVILKIIYIKENFHNK